MSKITRFVFLIIFIVVINYAVVPARLSGGPEVASNDSPTVYPGLFKVTSQQYNGRDNLEQAVENEYGSKYRIADWQDVLAYKNNIEQFIEQIKLEVGTLPIFLTWNGKHFHENSNRHFYIERYDHKKPDEYFAHDNIDDNLICLESWPGLKCRVLCILKEPATDKTAPQNTEAAKEFYNIGLAAFKDKEYEKARDLFIKAVSYDENFLDAYVRLGDIYQILKEEELAYESYKKCIELIDKSGAPSDETTKLREELRRKMEKFRSIDEKIYSLDGEFIFKLTELANKCLNEMDYLLAEESFSLVLLLEESNEEASKGLQKAREELDKKIQEEPATNDNALADAYYQSGLLLVKQNKYDEAIEKFNKALSCRKEFPEVLLRLGECYEKNKNTKEAINKYRSCIKCFESKHELNPDEKNIITQAQRNLIKLDTQSNELKGLKDKYISGLLGVANDCMTKKYLYLAKRICNKILKIDPNDKTASDTVKKIQDDISKKNSPFRTEVIIFNGNDLTNWSVPSSYSPLWSVEKPFLVFNRSAYKEPSSILWTKTPPANYIFSTEIFLEKMLPAKNYGISFVYGESIIGKQINSQTVQCTWAKIGSWGKARFIKQGETYKIEEGSKTSRTGKIQPLDTAVIGLYAEGYIAKFRNITLQETD